MKSFWVFLFLSAGCSSASPTTIGGACNTTEDCHSEWNNIPGSSCVDFKCVCDNPAELHCCPGGDIENCEAQPPKDYRCRPAAECFPPEPPDAGPAGSGGGSASAGAGGSGGAGGEPLPPPECIMDSECAGPPDPACGEGKCIDNHCVLDIWEGPALSQFYGDCRQVVCDVYGNRLEVIDVGDVYNDGNQCTYDSCVNGTPLNEPLLDGFKCPESGEGACYQGKCVECIDIIPYAQCAPGLACNGVYCVPFPDCSMAGCGGLCAPCAVGYGCQVDSDCFSNNCTNGMCTLADCMDGRRNGTETGVDCGSGSCMPCPDGEGCAMHTDCQSGVCMAGKCQLPSCIDAVQNGMESGIDCGGNCGSCAP